MERHTGTTLLIRECTSSVEYVCRAVGKISKISQEVHPSRQIHLQQRTQHSTAQRSDTAQRVLLTLRCTSAKKEAQPTVIGSCCAGRLSWLVVVTIVQLPPTNQPPNRPPNNQPRPPPLLLSQSVSQSVGCRCTFAKHYYISECDFLCTIFQFYSS